jgi:CMP-N-acetylneuraminic acid synthetase
MYKKRRILSVIPARGGSKGLKRKNVRLLSGLPLIAWTIEAARNSRYIDRVIVSTEDSKIARLASKFGAEVPFLRPARLSGDRAALTDVVLDVLDKLADSDRGWDYVILLQPTSPLRTSGDIDAAVEKFFSCKNADAIISVTEVAENPFAMQRITREGFLEDILPGGKNIHRRQDMPAIYKMNGAIYICKTEVLRRDGTFCPGKTIAFKMPGDRSVDVDDAQDLKEAGKFIKEMRQRKGRRS